MINHAISFFRYIVYHCQHDFRFWYLSLMNHTILVLDNWFWWDSILISDACFWWTGQYLFLVFVFYDPHDTHFSNLSFMSQMILVSDTCIWWATRYSFLILVFDKSHDISVWHLISISHMTFTTLWRWYSLDQNLPKRNVNRHHHRKKDRIKIYIYIWSCLIWLY